MVGHMTLNELLIGQFSCPCIMIDLSLNVMLSSLHYLRTP